MRWEVERQRNDETLNVDPGASNCPAPSAAQTVGARIPVDTSEALRVVTEMAECGSGAQHACSGVCVTGTSFARVSTKRCASGTKRYGGTMEGRRQVYVYGLLLAESRLC